MSALLAIVIPYYKASFFKETLQSLKDQTDKRFAVYIGDDASPEPALTMIEPYKKDLSITHRRFPDNLGSKSLTKQWDRCLDMIQDEKWVCILGDDDCISENFVETFYKKLPLLQKEKSRLLRFATMKINEQGAILDNLQENPETQSAVTSFIKKFYGTKHSSLSEYVFHRNSYTTYGFRDYPLAWCSDDMAWLEFSDGNDIISCNEAHIKFRLSAKSISGTLDTRKKEAKQLFFRDLVLEKQFMFPRGIAIKNLKKYEVFLVLTGQLRKQHFTFFLKRFFQLNSLIECFKFTLRYTKNMLK